MRQSGLSTLEILLACLIIGMLVTLSLPAFSDQVAKARRADAVGSLLNIQQAQELYRSNHVGYASSLMQLGQSEQSEGRYYRLSTSTEVATATVAYRALATAQNAQASDAACRYIALTVTGGVTLEQSGPTAALGNDATSNRLCWPR
jgi:type IV pilus assembly protein PilE